MLRVGLIGVIVWCVAGGARAEAPVEIVSASYWGTAEDDDIQGAAVAANGTIYIVGNTGAAIGELPGGIRAARIGQPAGTPRCGHGFVAQLSADGKKLLRYAEFARGAVLLTNVQVNTQGVYVSGYASDALEGVLADLPGMMRQFPLRAEIALYEADVKAGKEDKIAGRPGLARYGAPCVIRMPADLSKVEAGTYLEGWQQVWDKKRVAKPGKQMLGGYQEYFWQPTAVALLKSGDLMVLHDGGYFRMPAEKDKELAKGDEKLAQRLTFYDCCDYVSRLSADLTTRVWKKAIYTPPVDPKVSAQVKEGWPLPHYSSPRTHRLRIDKNEDAYICGWSASATSKEPYWAPYVMRLDAKTGDVNWKVYEYDPMSGGGNRMGGQVADTAAISVAIAEDGSLLTSLLADGGNSVMEWSPKAEKMGQPFEVKQKGPAVGVKLVHWWGQVQRVDVQTRQGLGRAHVGPWAWVHDLAGMPDNGIVAYGRWNWKFDFTPDAWADASVAGDPKTENPNAFLRVYAPDFSMTFSTALPGVYPFELVRSAQTIVLTGRAENGVAIARNGLVEKPIGKADGWVMVVRMK